MGDHPGAPLPHFGEELAAKRRLKRVHRIVGWACFSIIFLPVAGWIVAERVGERCLRRSLCKLQEAGFAIDLNTMVPAEVPSLDNAAPLYEAAFALIRDAHDPLAEIGDGIFGRYTPAGIREAARVLAPYEEVFGLVRRARSKPACRFRRNYDRPPDIRGPEWVPVMTLARALSVRAQIQASEGRRQEARETVRDLWSLADAFKNEPLSWSQLVRLHVWGQAREATVSCARDSGDEREWDRWLELLPDPSSLRQSVMLGFRGHLACWAADAKKGHAGALEEMFPHDTPWQRMLNRVYKPLLDIGSARGLCRYQSNIARWERAPFDYSRELYRDEGPPSRGLLDLSMVEIISPYRQGFLRRMAMVHASTAVARAGMECEKAWEREGRYPETLPWTDPLTGRGLEFSQDRASLHGTVPPAPHNFSYDPEAEGMVWNLLHVGD